MRSKVVDLHSICLGPFPHEFENFDIIISYLKKDQIEPIFSYKLFKENKFDDDGYNLVEKSRIWRTSTRKGSDG